MPIAVRVLSGCFVLHRADFCSLCVLLSFSHTHTHSLAVCAVSSGVVVVLKVNKKQAIRQNVAKKPLKRGKKMLHIRIENAKHIHEENGTLILATACGEMRVARGKH